MVQTFRDGQLLRASDLNGAFQEQQQEITKAKTTITGLAGTNIKPSTYSFPDSRVTDIDISGVKITGSAVRIYGNTITALKSGYIAITINYNAYATRAYVQLASSTGATYRQELNLTGGLDHCVLSVNKHMNAYETLKITAYKTAGQPTFNITGFFIEEGK